MKGTFFSADFVEDNNGNLRLIEVNTDTSVVYTSALDQFDFTDFIKILSDNGINTLNVVYKYKTHQNIVDKLQEQITSSAPFITSFQTTFVPSDSIFPTSPADNDTTFVLRLAYDETAILDSEYAKGTLNLLKLFADNNDANSVVNFYHSSPTYGTYNTLDNSITNPSNVPDFVVKSTIVNHLAFPFYKLGNSTSEIGERYTNFLSSITTNDNIIQQYHLSPDYTTNNKVTSIRSFQIIYGSNLDLCVVAEYEVEAVFELPTSFNYDDAQIANLIDTKHYYEFATNFIKNSQHGLLGSEMIVDGNGNEVQLDTQVTGNTWQSFFVNDAPEEQDDDIVAAWSYPGNQLPSGSYITTDTLLGLYEYTPFANDITKVTFNNSIDVYVGGETRLLTYDSGSNSLHYVRTRDLTTDDYVFDSNENLIPVTDVNYVILDQTQTLYSPSMESVGTFLIGGSTIVRLVSHNKITGCFDGECLVEMFDGSQKKIKDIKKGDVVKSYYKNEYVSGIVTDSLIHPINGLVDMIKKGKMISDTKHPLFIDGEWKAAEKLNDATHYTKFYDVLYNLEIDGDKIYESEHNYIIDGIICSGLGDNPILNTEFQRQDKHLLPYLN